MENRKGVDISDISKLAKIKNKWVDVSQMEDVRAIIKNRALQIIDLCNDCESLMRELDFDLFYVKLETIERLNNQC